MTAPPAPLVGLTVLEIGVFMAAPFATMRLSDTPAVQHGAGPVLGADTGAVLGELGYTEAQIEALTGTMPS